MTKVLKTSAIEELNVIKDTYDKSITNIVLIEKNSRYYHQDQ